MSNKRKLEPLPTFETDEEAERFVDEADLTDYDLSSGSITRFEFEKKTRAGQSAYAGKPGSCGQSQGCRAGAFPISASFAKRWRRRCDRARRRRQKLSLLRRQLRMTASVVLTAIEHTQDRYNPPFLIDLEGDRCSFLEGDDP